MIIGLSACDTANTWWVIVDTGEMAGSTEWTTGCEVPLDEDVDAVVEGAEKSRRWPFCGSGRAAADRGRKPRSAMWSASSST